MDIRFLNPVEYDGPDGRHTYEAGFARHPIEFVKAYPPVRVTDPSLDPVIVVFSRGPSDALPRMVVVARREIVEIRI